MEKFKHYLFITSLTLLFIFMGGIFANIQGVILALFVLSIIYIYSYFYRKEKLYISTEESRETENTHTAIYAVVARLIKRTDISYKEDRNPFKGNKYGTI